MDTSVETILEPERGWVAPELKKIDIAIITAIAPVAGADAQGMGSS